MPYKNKKVLVVGAGLSGEWAARLLCAFQAKVTLNDYRTAEQLSGSIANLKDFDIKWELGGHKVGTFLASDLIVLSPGIPWTVPGLREAQAKRIPIIGEMELAARELKVPMAAITGSNGKTTTTSLLGHICQKCGMTAFVGGNIGDPLSRFILDGQKSEVAVLEVSSFQLETVLDFQAKAAACLNISPDHLDRYGDMAEYFRTKMNIFNRQSADDLAVLNGDDVLLAHKNTMARPFIFSSKKRPQFGAWLAKDKIVVADGKKILAEKAWSDFQLWGVHNQENVMAAVGLALGLGLDVEAALSAAHDFKVADHRLQLVGEYGGVRYFDDSKGTNLGAVAAALGSFTEKVVLIIGGQGKGQDFHPLVPVVKKHVKHLVLIGEAKEQLADDLAKSAPMSVAASMAEAVAQAKSLAKKGEVVLLSPACASFDMFKDYKDRGAVFAREVKAQN